jgi:hypothetical protein
MVEPENINKVIFRRLKKDTKKQIKKILQPFLGCSKTESDVQKQEKTSNSI